MRRTLVSIMFVVGSSLVAVPALAQTPPASKPETTATPATTDPAKLDEARQRYQRGLQLFSEANYDAARVEFERAYQLAPSYKILYNIGLCYEQLGDYVQAQSTLQRYLDIGGKEVSEERRAEVAKELAQIRPRIARLTIKVNVPGAEVLVDDACTTDASTALQNCGPFDGNTRTVLLNPGRRRLSVRRDGYFPESMVVTVAGSDQTDITTTLRPLPREQKEKKTNPFVVPMIIGFGVTGVGLIGATITGVMASGAQSDQEDALAKFPASRQELDDARDKTETLSTASDIFLIGSGVAAGVSTYFLIRALSWKGESGDVNVQVGANRLGIAGHF